MTGFQIKLLAFIFMIFDHSAYMFPDVLPLWFRLAGRFSFPVFAFFIAEGCRKTRSMEKYIFRLGLLALISEIPYDLCFNDSINFLEDMNIGWTLSAGAVIIYIFKMKTGPALKGICAACVLGALSFSDLDYGLWGVMLILVYYLFEGKPAVIFSTVIIFTLKWAGFIYPFSFYTMFWFYSCLGWILPVLYNGEKGGEPKYFFYGAYVLHLAVLLLMRVVV